LKAHELTPGPTLKKRGASFLDENRKLDQSNLRFLLLFPREGGRGDEFEKHFFLT
jgi:hypothetical protein